MSDHDHDATQQFHLPTDEGQLLTDAQRAYITDLMRRKLDEDGAIAYYLHSAPYGTDELAEDIGFSVGAPEGSLYNSALAFLWNDGITTTEVYHLALDLARETEPDYTNPSHVEVCPRCQRGRTEAEAADQAQAEAEAAAETEQPAEPTEQPHLFTLMYSTLASETLAVVRVYDNAQIAPFPGSNAAYATLEVEDPALEQPIRFRSWLRGQGAGWVAAIQNLYGELDAWLGTGPGPLFEAMFATRPQLVQAETWEGDGPDDEQYRFVAYSDGLGGYLVEVSELSTFNTGTVATPLNAVIGEGSTSVEAYTDAWEKLVEHIEASGTPLCAHCRNRTVEQSGEVCGMCLDLYGHDLDDATEPASEPATN